MIDIFGISIKKKEKYENNNLGCMPQFICVYLATQTFGMGSYTDSERQEKTRFYKIIF